jgi:hypothetical protein
LSFRPRCLNPLRFDPLRPISPGLDSWPNALRLNPRLLIGRRQAGVRGGRRSRSVRLSQETRPARRQLPHRRQPGRHSRIVHVGVEIRPVLGLRRLLADSLRICLDLNDGWFLGRICTYLAETALWKGELDAAERWLAQSLTYHASQRWIRMDKLERLTVAARLAAAQGAYLRAAALFGLADEMRNRIHYELAGPARQLLDDALARVRAALDPALFEEVFAAGRRLSLEEAFATILAPGAPSSGPDRPGQSPGCRQRRHSGRRRCSGSRPLAGPEFQRTGMHNLFRQPIDKHRRSDRMKS